MKKNLAIFMAAMMALTAVPVTSVFAAADVSISGADYYAKEPGAAYDGGAPDEAISYYLDIVLDEDVEKDSKFVAELTGAKFTNLAGGGLDVSYFDDEDDTTSEETVYFADKRGANGLSGGSQYTGIVFDVNDNYAPSVTEATKVLQDLQEKLETKEESLDTLWTDAETATPAIELLEQEVDNIQLAIDAVNALLATGATVQSATYFQEQFANYTGAQLQTLLAQLQALQPKVVALATEVASLEAQIEEIIDANEGATTVSALSAVFGGFANAGIASGTTRTMWTNTMNVGTKGDYSADEGSVIVKKFGDRTMRATFTKAINADDDNQITVRIPLPITIDADAESVELAITDSTGEVPIKSFMLVDTASDGTVTSSDGIAKGVEIIELETILIREATTGVFEQHGAFELVAPDGYRFRNKLTDVKISATGDASFDILNLDADGKPATTHIVWTDDDDNTSLAIALDIKKSSRLPGTIKVSGLVIEPIDDESIVDGEELFMTVRNFTDDATVAAENYGFIPGSAFVKSDNSIRGIRVDTEDFKVADSVAEFAPSTAYTATVTLNSKDGYQFTNATAVDVSPGGTVDADSISITPSTLSFTVTYPATEETEEAVNEDANTPLKAHVVISAGSTTALVDGKEITMTDVVPYRTTAEGNNFMIPLRFISYIFGVKAENYLWDNASKTVTILLDGRRIIQFVGGEDYYTVNGAKVQMLTGTTPIYTEIDPAEELYVPFRHLGRAFGIADADITYDEETETAQYNQPIE